MVGAPERHRHGAVKPKGVLRFNQYDQLIQAAIAGQGTRFTPHAAFDHPEAPADAPLRESIELRRLVIYD